MKSAADPTATPPSASQAAEDPMQTLREASPPSLQPVVQSLPQPAAQQLAPQTKKPQLEALLLRSSETRRILDGSVQNTADLQSNLKLAAGLFLWARSVE